MNLEQALQQIALDAGLDAAALIRYAAEDRIGGRDTIMNRVPADWSAMSTFGAEGQVIYALVRALRPAHVLEVGVASGGTSTHILTALEANDYGTLWSIDIAADCGLDVPAHLRHRWTFVTGDALTAELPDQADFIFEDGAHTYDFTFNMLSRLKELNPRVLMSHDYYTHEVYGGFAVKQAWDEVLPEGKGIKLDGAFTGLGYWVNEEYGQHQALERAAEYGREEVARQEVEQAQILEHAKAELQAIDEPTPKPAAKRGRKSKAAK